VLQTKGKLAMQLGYTILYVPDVPATLKFYEAAFGLPTRPLEVMPWGQTIAYVADINGFLCGTVHAYGVKQSLFFFG
jgi:catechol 2,3-dioxygenase-like lactoylglutathione lyase family enzyme